jgi:molybdenum cofactor cytidylyltransferase
MITSIVLAAGMSRRMGEANKMLLPFRDSTIFETTLSNISKADIGKIVVVVGYESKKIKNVLESTPLSIFNKIEVIENKAYEKGMTTSIKAGIRSIRIPNPKSETHFMICLSDMPLISPEEYRFMATQFSTILKEDEQAIVVPFFKGEKGNPVIFSAFYKNELLNLEDTEGGKTILQKYKNHVYKIEMPTDAVLLDADTPEDYLRLKRGTD